MRRSFVFASLVLLPLSIVPACSNQGEGERCDVLAANNGNDDCQAGLECVPPGQLQWPAPDGGKPQTTTTGICCPTNRSTARVDVCKMNSSNIGNDASFMPDVIEASANEGGMDAGEGGSDASTEAGDAASDAPTDAPGEGG